MTLIFVIFVLLGVGYPGWTQQLLDNNYLMPVDHQIENLRYGKIFFTYNPRNITLLGACYQGYIIVDAYDEATYIYTISDVKIYNDGYIYANAGYDLKNEPFLVLKGGDTIIHISKEYYSKPNKYFGGQEAMMGAFLAGGPEWAYYMLNIKEIEKTGDLYTGGDTGFWDDGIKSLSAWSTLTEKTKTGVIIYSPDRMRHPFYGWGDMEINFNNASLFWAEGEPGPGIGGTIDVEFTRDTDHVMVLNGAVDLTRRYLYKANNRLKRVLIESEDSKFSIEYTFEDIVQFNKITFPKKTKKIRITILDVYKGENWDDTCVSAIFLKQQELRPRTEYEKVIEEYIKYKGFDKKIEAYNRRKMDTLNNKK